MKKPTKSEICQKARQPLDVPRVGTVSRLDFTLAIGVTKRTVDRWIHDGIDGLRLPCQFVGERIFIAWDEYREWQEKIKNRKLGIRPAPRRKSDPAAHESLKRNGYL